MAFAPRVASSDTPPSGKDFIAHRRTLRDAILRVLLVSASAAMVLRGRSPVWASILFIGTVCGSLNLILVSQSGERFVMNRVHRSMRTLQTLVRLAFFASCAVLAGYLAELPGIGWYFLGFFAPFLWYAACTQLRLQRETRTDPGNSASV